VDGLIRRTIALWIPKALRLVPSLSNAFLICASYPILGSKTELMRQYL
jgi:hypothetical protein